MTADHDGVLEVFDLHLARDGRKILRGVDLALERGKVHAILGLNGSGKTTLAYTLMGSAGYRPDQGEIWMEGEEITGMSITERAQRGMTLAWQEPARFEGLTVARYISLGMEKPDMERIRAALNFVVLNPDIYLSRYVDETLSGGERKRVELAAVYAMQPKVAILDEPDSGVDIMSLDDISALIHRLAEEGTAVLLVSHRNEVVELSDVASMICEGKVVSTDKPRAVCDLYNQWCQPCDTTETVEMEGEYERL